MSALIRWFFLNLYTVFCTDCTDKGGGGGGGEGGGEGSNRPMPHFLDKE